MQQIDLNPSGHDLFKYGRTITQFAGAGCLLVLASACTGVGKEPVDVGSSSLKAEHQRAIPRRSRRLLVAEKLFKQKAFGLAEREYRAVVQQDRSNYLAWLGLAATYDKMGRFKLALRSYKAAIDIKGATPEILNNLGYHFILKGNLVDARKALTKAQRMEPTNEYIKNNIKILEEREATLGVSNNEQEGDYRSDRG